MAAEDQLSRAVVDLGRRVGLLERGPQLAALLVPLNRIAAVMEAREAELTRIAELMVQPARPRDVEAGLLRPMSGWQPPMPRDQEP